MLKLENIWKIYQLGKVEVTVLRGISLEITSGCFMALMGPSGSGKSTLLHIIGCLDTPTKGKVFLGGQDISQLSEDDLARIRGKKIGFVFQQFNLLPNFNALENVMLPMIFQGIPQKAREEKARNLLAATGLKERILHKPSELSGGEQQRIAISRALANDPEIIVADEPTGNLDSQTGKKIMEVLIDLHKNRKKTIVVVTHDPNIAGYAEEVINLKDGQIASNHQAGKEYLWQKNNNHSHA